MTTPRILSVRNPWAWAILHGGKDVENRSRPTRHRGDVWLHASASMTTHEWDLACAFMAGIGARRPPPRETLAMGAIVGAFVLADCVTAHASPWFVGAYGYVVRDAVALPEPVPCRGALGLWAPPPAVMLRVFQQLERMSHEAR
jgi:ASCH domain